jgi:hypothetical protein
VQTGSPPSTPRKRKAEDGEEKKPTPSKKAKQPDREVLLDGIPFESDTSDSPSDLKAEETAAGILGSFQSYHDPFTATAFYPVVGMDGGMGQPHGHFQEPGSGPSSFLA